MTLKISGGLMANMKGPLLLIILVLFSLKTAAQKYDTIYYFQTKAQFLPVKPEFGTFYALIEHDSIAIKSGLVKSYYLTGENHGTFAYFEGEMNGPYQIQYKTGNPRYNGVYRRSQKVGLVKEWYANGQLKLEERYDFEGSVEPHSIEIRMINSWDSLGNEMVVDGSGPFKEYTGNGRLILEGSYMKGKKFKDWKGYYPDGNTFYVESYLDGGELISGTSYDEQGNGYTYNELEVPPEFPGGIKLWSRFLRKNLKYPKKARRKGIQGMVFITFLADQNGQVIDAQVVKGIGWGCNEEALRVIRMSPLWVPGIERGQKVESRFAIQIQFRLR